MTAGLAVSKTDRALRLEGSGHNKLDCNLLKCNTTINIIYYWTRNYCTKWSALSEVCALRFILLYVKLTF